MNKALGIGRTCPSLNINRSSRKRGENGTETMSKERTADNSLFLMKGIQETQCICHGKTKQNKKKPSHIMYKLMKIKYKNVLKTARRKE